MLVWLLELLHCNNRLPRSYPLTSSFADKIRSVLCEEFILHGAVVIFPQGVGGGGGGGGGNGGEVTYSSS